jgi:threonine/homoserine/homoserine lactone efflux protein
MIAYDPLVIFLLASLFLAITPGPDNLYVLMQSVVYGYKTGVFITLGLCTGLIMHTAAVAMGLTLLLQSSPYILPLLKLFGAGYLVYLSSQSYRAEAIDISLLNHEALTILQSYQRGIILNVSNPKVGLFFLAFLPQFTNIEQGGLVEQTLLLGFMFIAITVIVFTVIALISSSLRDFLIGSPRVQKVMHRVTALVLLGLALHLVIFI